MIWLTSIHTSDLRRHNLTFLFRPSNKYCTQHCKSYLKFILPVQNCRQAVKSHVHQSCLHVPVAVFDNWVFLIRNYSLNVWCCPSLTNPEKVWKFTLKKTITWWHYRIFDSDWSVCYSPTENLKQSQDVLHFERCHLWRIALRYCLFIVFALKS